MEFEENTGTSIWVTLVKLVLLVVTGIMTWQFLSYVMGPDKQLFAILGLVAFEGGILLWPMVYKRDAVTPTMEGIAVTMIAVSWVGIGLAFIGEIMRYNPEAAALLEWMIPVMPFAVGAIVLLNVLAYTAIQMLSPKAAMERADRQAAMARARADLLYKQQAARAIIAAAQADAPDAAQVSAAQTVGALGARHRKGGTHPNGASTGTAQGGDDFLPPPAASGTPSTRGKSTPRSQPPR